LKCIAEFKELKVDLDKVAPECLFYMMKYCGFVLEGSLDMALKKAEGV
jgi:hypothetical protein